MWLDLLRRGNKISEDGESIFVELLGGSHDGLFVEFPLAHAEPNMLWVVDDCQIYDFAVKPSGEAKFCYRGEKAV